MRQAFDAEKFLFSGAVMSLDSKMLLVQWGDKSWHAQPEGHSAGVLYFPDFFLTSPHPWCTHPYSLVMDAHSLQQQLQGLFLDKASPFSWDPIGLNAFKDPFGCLHSALTDGLIKKGVPYVFQTASATLSSRQIRDSLLNLLRNYSHSPSYLYGFWGPNEGVLGLTPELLCRYDLESLSLETMALAGTIPSGDEAFLDKDEKITAEHHWVVEGIKETLAPLGIPSISKKEILRLPHLSHLLTHIRTKLHRPEPISKIIESLHPTPALGGYPKESVFPLLQELAVKVPRGRYGAPVGVLYGSQAHCYVGIRNIQWDGACARIGAGCGIVKESELNKEWEEIQWKLHAIQQMLFAKPSSC
jgi:menaquinone-specific isochorismate synthase